MNMTEDPVQKYQTDHDLLVRLDERYGAMHQDIKDMKEGTTKRIDELEKDHVSKQDIVDLTTVIGKMKDEVDSLKLWRSALLGAYGLTLILLPMAFAYFT